MRPAAPTPYPLPASRDTVAALSARLAGHELRRRAIGTGMRLFRHHTEVPVEARGAVMVLDNFDGVHRGSQAVIAEAARRANELRTSLAVLTFEPHPREFFAPDRPPFRLTPFRIRVRHLEAAG